MPEYVLCRGQGSATIHLSERVVPQRYEPQISSPRCGVQSPGGWQAAPPGTEPWYTPSTWDVDLSVELLCWRCVYQEALAEVESARREQMQSLKYERALARRAAIWGWANDAD